VNLFNRKLLGFKSQGHPKNVANKKIILLMCDKDLELRLPLLVPDQAELPACIFNWYNFTNFRENQLDESLASFQLNQETILYKIKS